MTTSAPRQMAEDERVLRARPLAVAEPKQSGASQLLQLQRSAGNRAVTQTLTQPTVQRALATRASDLDKAFGLGALGANVGRGTFAAIRRTLATYQRLHDPAAKADVLHTLGGLISRWMVEHKGKGAADMERRRVLEHLEGEITTEQLAVAKDQADAKYLSNVQNAGLTDSGDKHALKALTEQTKGELDDRSKPVRARAGRAAALGLTEAELAAVKIFTSAGADYGYINPATANDDTWYEGAQANKKTSPGFRSEASHEERKAEGRLHAGMAIKGLTKLPAYGPDVYRGLGYQRLEFHREFTEGGTYTVPALGSASVRREVAERYAATSGKHIAVLLVIHKSGGRDISAFSTEKDEAEVTLIPRDYKIQSIKQVPNFTSTGTFVPDPEAKVVLRYYEVHVTG